MAKFAQFLPAAIALACAIAGIAQDVRLSLADRAFIPILKRTDGDLKNFAIVTRRQVTDNLDLALALGSPNAIQKTDDEWFSWSQEDRLGIFLQDRSDASRVFLLTVAPGPPCRIHLERATGRDVLISCPGEYDWGNGADNQKFVFDTRSKHLTEHYSYPPFANYVLVAGRHAPDFVADNPHNLLAATWDESANGFRLLSDAAANAVFKKISIQTESAGGIERRVPILPKTERLSFGPNKKFELLLHTQDWHQEDHYPMIVENVGTSRRQLPLPQSSRKEWSLRRPEEKNDVLPASTVEIEEHIGPYQVEGDRLWFGKRFYDGEGVTGVGGFGYFDAISRSYKLYAPREIWPWSVSALLVMPDAVWLGLVHYGEGADASGGLLHWDGTTALVHHFDLKVEVNQIVRGQDALYLATSDGIEVLHGDEMERYIVDSTSNGKFSVIPCEGGYR